MTILSFVVSRPRRLAAAALLVAVGACSSEPSSSGTLMAATPGSVGTVPAADSTSITLAGEPTSVAAVRALARRRIYFGHQSVGGNIVAGLEQLLRDRPDIGLKIVQTHEASVLAGPAFVHFYAGRNTDPASKNADFQHVLDGRPRPDSAIAMLKYCFVDMTDSTDPAALFAAYQKTIAEVRAKHPDVTIVHVTMPLMTVESAPKAWAKRLLGRTPERDLEVKRNAYNALVRRAYAGKEPLFDLAAFESTHADGRRSFFVTGGDTVYTLAREYTWDGGHLNDRAERLAAERLLATLAALPPVPVAAPVVAEAR